MLVSRRISAIMSTRKNHNSLNNKDLQKREISNRVPSPFQDIKAGISSQKRPKKRPVIPFRAYFGAILDCHTQGPFGRVSAKLCPGAVSKAIRRYMFGGVASARLFLSLWGRGNLQAANPDGCGPGPYSISIGQGGSMQIVLYESLAADTVSVECSAFLFERGNT